MWRWRCCHAFCCTWYCIYWIWLLSVATVLICFNYFNKKIKKLGSEMRHRLRSEAGSSALFCVLHISPLDTAKIRKIFTSWIKPLCIGLAVLVGARISSVNHLGQLSEIICEVSPGSLVCESLARSLLFSHPFFGLPCLFPTPRPKRNPVRFLGRYF